MGNTEIKASLKYTDEDGNVISYIINKTPDNIPDKEKIFKQMLYAFEQKDAKKYIELSIIWREYYCGIDIIC